MEYTLGKISEEKKKNLPVTLAFWPTWLLLCGSYFPPERVN